MGGMNILGFLSFEEVVELRKLLSGRNWSVASDEPLDGGIRDAVKHLLAMIKAAEGELKGILGINQKPLVSKDFNHNKHSSIFDVTQTQVIKGKFSRVLSWYDNEWGFSNRMCDTTIQIAGLI